MRARPLGKTGLVISEMALGTWGLSGDAYGAVTEEDAEKIVARALEMGVDVVDTCDAYAGGKTEALLGRALKEKKDVTVVTRGGVDRTTDPPTKKFTLEHLRGAAQRSAKRLGRDALDLYLIHNPSPDALAVGEAVDAMTTLKKEGLVRHWGVSAGDLDVARAAIDKGAEVVSLAYNLFQQSDLHRLAGDLMVSGAGVLAHSALSYGLFSGIWSKERTFEQGDHRNDRWTRLELERRLDDLDSIRHLIKGDVMTMRGAAVRFVLANHLVSAVILGPRTVKQLEELVRDTGGGPRYLPDADLRELPRMLEKAGIEV